MRVAPGRDDQVLQRRAEGGFDRPFQPGLDLELGCHGAENAGQAAAARGLQDGARAAGVTRAFAAKALQQVKAGLNPVNASGRLPVKLLTIEQLGLTC